jgi:hypothetical protein
MLLEPTLLQLKDRQSTPLSKWVYMTALRKGPALSYWQQLPPYQQQLHMAA